MTNLNVATLIFILAALYIFMCIYLYKLLAPKSYTKCKPKISKTPPIYILRSFDTYSRYLEDFIQGKSLISPNHYFNEINIYFRSINLILNFYILPIISYISLFKFLNAEDSVKNLIEFSKISHIGIPLLITLLILLYNLYSLTFCNINNKHINRYLLIHHLLVFFRFLVIFNLTTYIIDDQMYASETLHETIRLCISILAAKTLVFWKLRAKYSNQWLYCAQLYNSIMLKEGDPKIENLQHNKLILLIDILRLDMWNNKSFRLFFQKNIKLISKDLSTGEVHYENKIHDLLITQLKNLEKNNKTCPECEQKLLA